MKTANYTLKIAMCWLLILSASLTGFAQQLVINEIMASNGSTLADENGDYEDWIELHNYGAVTLSLAGYGLSDSYGNPFKWVFPSVNIQPGGYLLVWASGKNKTHPNGHLHTNFSISASGEEILLTHRDGYLIDVVEPVPVPTDISYGRSRQNPEDWLYFDQPTPRAVNAPEGYAGLLQPPVFSQQGGFYLSGFQLSLSHPNPEAIIIFTLDGSEPAIENTEGSIYHYKNAYAYSPWQLLGELIENTFQSHIYNDEIEIYDRTPEPDRLSQISTTVHFPYYFPEEPVIKGTMVRARAFREGYLPSEINTQSFFVNPAGREMFSLPVISIGVQENYLFDYYDGIYTAGFDADSWRKENPDEVFSWPFAGNFHRRGEWWEYPASLEYFDEENALSVHRQQLGVRLHGGATRSYPMKSFRLYGRAQYGNTHLDYPFFGDNGDARFKRLILRNSGNDFPSHIWEPEITSRTMFRDAAIQEIMKGMNFDIQNYAPAIVFLNGEYWGLMNIRERFDKHYLERVYGINPDNIDIVTGKDQVIEGSNYHYVAMINYINQNGVQSPHHYNFILTRMDVENFTDYQIANIFADNTDWPGNNIDFWRLKVSPYNPNAPYGHDGRWRWMLYDTDFGFGGFGAFADGPAYTFNTLAFATATNGPEWPNPDWSTFLLRKLLENEVFRINFINRFADLLNTSFLPERSTGIINTIKNKIAPEIETHFNRWNPPQNMRNWNENVQVMLDFAVERPAFQREHLMDYFGLEGEITATLDVSSHWHGHIRLNSIDLHDGTPGVSANPYPWQGLYFKNIPLTVKAIPAPGYTFSHWEGLPDGTPDEIAFTPDSSFSLKAYFVKSGDPELIYFWVFDGSLPNDTPLESIAARYELPGSGLLQFHSALDGYPFSPAHPNWRKASMERRNSPTPLNYRPEGNNSTSFEASGMRGLQIKQPFTGDGGENQIIFNLPAINYKSLVFSFAAKDEGAANFILLEYSAIPGNPEWTTSGITASLPLSKDYQLYVFDFSGINLVNDNPDFKIRISFMGSGMSADDGNRVTFNNFSLDGEPITGTNLPPLVMTEPGLQQLIENGLTLQLDLNNYFNDPENDPLEFMAQANNNFVQLSLNQNLLTVEPFQRGGTLINITADDGFNNPVPLELRVLIYPAAYPFGDGDFTFDYWDAGEPENSYPPNMLFLQSDRSDPGIDDLLLYPYFIPHNDYHANDQATIGFPYNNTGRSRINGLNEDGISFINTGRDRDLGGALLAIDTRGVSSARLGWLNATIQDNPRRYAIRLQYRTSLDQPFRTLLHNSQPLEYEAAEAGHLSEFSSVELPSFLLQHEYVQLLWRYYHLSGDAGPRSELRLDNISISEITGIGEFTQVSPRIYVHNGTLVIQLSESTGGDIGIYDLAGRLVMQKKLSDATTQLLPFNSRSGIYIVRIITQNQVFSKKILIP